MEIMKIHKFANLVKRSLKQADKKDTLFVLAGAEMGGFNHWWVEPQRHVRKTLHGILKQSTAYCMKHRVIRIYEIDLSKIKPIYEGTVGE